jgi:iron(III) transport system ATP-binding protein
VAVARALVLEPQVLLFDEPLSNLDARLRRKVREDIREIQQNLGVTVVYVTHDQEEALAVSDRIIVMNNARIAQIGTPRELYDAPVDAFVADFIGEANLIKCNVETIAGDSASIRIGTSQYVLPARGLAAGTALLAVRPNRVILGPAADPNTIPGKLLKATYAGEHMEYLVATDFGEVFATSSDVASPLSVGSEIGVGFVENEAVLIPPKVI